MWSSDPCEGLTICRAGPLFHPDLVHSLGLNLLPQVRCFIDRATSNSGNDGFSSLSCRGLPDPI